VAERLAAYFDATLVASGYSRLVIDLNRQLWRHDSIPEVSECTPIPGNCNLSEAERAARAEALHRPYHEAIDELLTARTLRGIPTAYVAIHSFTPSFKGDTRPWPIALLSHRDRRMTDLLLEALRAEPHLMVGDNTPYRVTDETDYGIPVHAERRGLPHLLIELRQDEIATPAGQEAWAMRLAPLLAKVAERLGLTTGG
jgi:predicted N-formylglutamate amidohydrolase